MAASAPSQEQSQHRGYTFTDADRERAKAAQAARARPDAERDAQEMQAIAKKIAQTHPDDAVRLQAIKAYDVMADRIRILQGKPLPGALTHEKQPRKGANAKRSAFNLGMLLRDQAAAEPPQQQDAPSGAAAHAQQQQDAP